MTKSILRKDSRNSAVKFESVNIPKLETVPKTSLFLEEDDKTKETLSFVDHEKNISQLLYLKGIMKQKVEKLYQKFENQKALDFETHKLILCRNELERCVMCLFRNREFLKDHLKNLDESIKKEDANAKENLQTEINKKDLLVREKESVRNALLKKDEELREKIGELSEKFQNKNLERDRLKNQRDNLMQSIEKLNEEIDLTQKKTQEEIEHIFASLRANKDMYERDFVDTCKEISGCEKKLAELHIKAGEMFSTMSTLKEKAEKTSGNEEQLIETLNHLMKVRDELEERSNVIDQQLEECYGQVTEMCKEHVTYANIIKEYHDIIAARKLEREDTIRENHELQENLCKLHEKIGHNKRVIEELIKENTILKERKQALDYKLKCFDCKHIHSKISRKHQERTELLRTIENLEQNIMEMDKEILENKDVNMNATVEYNQVLEKVNEIESIVKEKEWDLLCLEEILKSKSQRVEFSKHNCAKLEDRLASKKNALKNCDEDNQKICKENQKLSLKIKHLEDEISEQQSISKTYKNQMEVLQKEKTLVDEKLVDLRHIEDRKNELQANNLELEIRLKTLKTNHQTVLDCLDTLRKIMEDQKERLDVQEAQDNESTSHSYCYTRYSQRTENKEFDLN